MAEYPNVAALLNTTEGMTATRANSKNDDGTDTVTGVSWFFFDGAAASSVYVSGNNWLGFGASAEQLKIWRRDGAVYSVYRQEGTIHGGPNGAVRFFKLRAEGFVAYSATAAADALRYEVFLFDTGQLLLYVLQTPAAARADAVTALVCGGVTLPLTVGPAADCPVAVTLTPADAAAGTGWAAAYSVPSFDALRWLVKSGNDWYTVTKTDGNAALTKADGLAGVSVPTASQFLGTGSAEPPPAAGLAALPCPTVYKWSDGAAIAPVTAAITAVPPPQTVQTACALAHASIRGIASLAGAYSGDVGVCCSVDGGASWSEETTLAAFLTRDPAALWASLGADRRLLLRLILYAGGALARLQFSLRN